MKIFFRQLFFIILLSSFAAMSYAAQANVNNQNAASKNKTEYLFVQTAATGELVYEAKSLSYKLKLRKVDPLAIYFSIAPEREGGFKSMPALVNLIKSEIAGKYPQGLNAGLTLFENGKDKPTHYAITIKNPVYDSKTRTMVYSASILVGSKLKPLVGAMHFKRAALFIDDMSNPDGGGDF
jgi:hypothetical protein